MEFLSLIQCKIIGNSLAALTGLKAIESVLLVELLSVEDFELYCLI